MSKTVTVHTSVDVDVDVELSDIDDDDLTEELESRGYVVRSVEEKDEELVQTCTAIYEAMQTDPALAWKRMAALVEEVTGRIVTTAINKVGELQ